MSTAAETQRRDWRRSQKIVLPIVTFVASVAVYWQTMARTVTLADSGELILACATLGVSHPPGAPFYTLLGHLFTRLPIGSVAARVTFMSAIFAALAASVVALITVEVSSSLRDARDGGKEKRKSDKPKDSGAEQAAGTVQSILVQGLQWLMPVAVGLTFAYSLSLWYYASVAEVYTLNVALFAVLVWLMLRWQAAWSQATSPISRQRQRVLMLSAAITCGLALGVHHVSILLAVPAFMYIVWRTAGRQFFLSREVAYGIGGLLLGLSVYLYLPLASARAPVLNWSNTASWAGFYRHVSGKMYQRGLFSADLGREVDYFFDLILTQFTPLGLALVLLGLWVLWRRDNRLFRMVGLIVGFDVAYSLSYLMDADKDAYYLTTNLVLMIALAAGLKYLLDVAATKGSAVTVAALGILVALPVVNWRAHYFKNDKSQYTIAQDYVENVTRPIEPGGLLLTLDWQFYAPYLYLRHVENFRPDVTVVEVKLLRETWYLQDYLRRQYPLMMQSVSSQAQALIEDMTLFEQGKLRENRIEEKVLALVKAMIDFHATRGPVYSMLPMINGLGIDSGRNWQPQGLTVRFYPDGQPSLPQRWPLQLRGLLDGSVYLDDPARQRVKPTYAFMMGVSGAYLAQLARYDEALESFHLSVQLDPGMTPSHASMGDVYALQGKFQAAAESYRRALDLDPTNDLVRQRLYEVLRRLK